MSSSPSSALLLGPPAIAGKSLLHPPENPLPSTETTVDSLIFLTANLDLAGKPPMGLTENLSATYLATGNPCLDFFFHIVPDTPVDDLVQRLQLAWAHDPLTTLKLICNLRGVRGTGKSDKEGFYAAAFWLYKHHPKTLSLNAKAIAEFGYFKDFPEILYRIIEGLEVRKKVKRDMMEQRRGNRGRVTKRRSNQEDDPEAASDNEREEEEEEEEQKEEREMKVQENKKGKDDDQENGKKMVIDKETARKLRKEREAGKAAKALQQYKFDENYRVFFDSVADLFANFLISDIEALNSKQFSKISLASKWCPSIDSSYDKSTLLCEAIARRIFPREGNKEYEGIDEPHYVYRVRDRLRKEVLVPLHKVLQLPELFMSSNEWNSLPYNRVASVAMKNYKELFLKHDKERFEGYLEKVKSGEAKIAAGALLPHEIIAALKDGDGGKVAELQWTRMVDDLAKKGKLKNCIAVCDVSGSMEGIPMEVSVALGLLVSEMSEEPWKGKVITFSENPQMHLIKGDTLLEKTEFVRRMEWGGNTDFQKVFDRILEVAVANKLSEDQLIKRVFVFSDMEFDDATREYHNDLWGEVHSYAQSKRDEAPEEEKCSVYSAAWSEKQIEVSATIKAREENKWQTDYEVIQGKFKEKGYNRVPDIVFWNLRSSKSTPVVGTQSGVALVSGFSKNLLTLFLEEGGIVNAEDVMGLAIGGEEYKKLVVYD